MTASFLIVCFGCLVVALVYIGHLAVRISLADDYIEELAKQLDRAKSENCKLLRIVNTQNDRLNGWFPGATGSERKR